MRDVFFSVLILVLSKVSGFHNEAHTFLYQKKLDTNFLTLPIGILTVCSYHVTSAFQSESTLLELLECRETPCSKQVRYMKFK